MIKWARSMSFPPGPMCQHRTLWSRPVEKTQIPFVQIPKLRIIELQKTNKRVDNHQAGLCMKQDHEHKTNEEEFWLQYKLFIKIISKRQYHIQILYRNAVGIYLFCWKKMWSKDNSVLKNFWVVWLNALEMQMIHCPWFEIK